MGGLVLIKKYDHSELIAKYNADMTKTVLFSVDGLEWLKVDDPSWFPAWQYKIVDDYTEPPDYQEFRENDQLCDYEIAKFKYAFGSHPLKVVYYTLSK